LQACAAAPRARLSPRRPPTLPAAPATPQNLPDSWMVDYNAALATIGFMVLLGFADDVLDIRW
jgi:hypothetical protein